MNNGFFVITGTSRGIGEALAQVLLDEGNTVLGVSRTQSATLKSPEYHHLSYDLTDTTEIDRIMSKAVKIIGNRSFDFVCLVNNASATEPIKSIEQCSATEIEAHVRIGLLAPMILTSLFIREFSEGTFRKKVTFISSGAAFNALPDESIYCSSKAGVHMFAQCVGLEQKNKDHGFEVISIGPGMVDTSMQLAVRSKTSEEFALADFFRQAFEEGRLQEPERVAQKIVQILLNHYEQGQYVSVNEV